MTTLHAAIFVRVINVFLDTGGRFSTGRLYRRSAQCMIASITGTFVYKEDTSKLMTISSGSSRTDFSFSHTDVVDELILHSGTAVSHSATCLATLWYADPGIDSTGRIGVFFLWTFAKP